MKMMEAYQDIIVLEQAQSEMGNPLLTGKAMEGLHKALVSISGLRIGVSFPLHTENDIGGHIRLHGKASDLERLSKCKGMSHLDDYLEISEFQPTPAEHRFQNVRRVQSKSNPARVRRRIMRNLNVSEEEALKIYPDSKKQILRLPYFLIDSASTGQKSIRVFVKHTMPLDRHADGDFGSYGLSPVATVPLF